MRIAVIIATYELGKRGYDRLKMGLFSLYEQSHEAPLIYVVDGSGYDEATRFENDLEYETYPGIEFIGQMTMPMNLPVLWNTGMKYSNADYFLITGADFLYSSDLLDQYRAMARPDRFICKQVRMMPEGHRPTHEQIMNWDFPTYPYNEFGKAACGIQFFHRDWFTRSGGYDEDMVLLGGMDEDMLKRATAAGLEIHWMTEGDILHQWHPSEKNKMRIRGQMKKNWELRDTRTTIKRNG